MSDHLRQHYGAEVTLVNGSGGVFDVEIDGRLVFSKHEQGRFPTHDEIDRLIAGA